jgi:putative phosphoribosyl transferase
MNSGNASMRSVVIPIPHAGVTLPGDLVLPEPCRGLILFAHGSGSSRLSPRNQMVAERLQEAGLGTLLFDLLTPDETRDRDNVFNIPLLAERLGAAAKWVEAEPRLAALPMGYFGASTGAAAALVAASMGGKRVAAVVSRGGRPDLAGEALSKVTAPTLLIVGGHDELVLSLNRLALDRLAGPKRLVIVPGATHLFEEPGTLESVARLATEWFVEHLGGAKG